MNHYNEEWVRRIIIYLLLFLLFMIWWTIIKRHRIEIRTHQTSREQRTDQTRKVRCAHAHCAHTKWFRLAAHTPTNLIRCKWHGNSVEFRRRENYECIKREEKNWDKMVNKMHSWCNRWSCTRAHTYTKLSMKECFGQFPKVFVLFIFHRCCVYMHCHRLHRWCIHCAFFLDRGSATRMHR